MAWGSCVVLSLLAGLAVIAGCGQSPTQTSSDRSPAASERRGASVGSDGTRWRSSPDTVRRIAVRDDGGSDDVLMSPGLHGHPDPAIRLHALEVWAQDSGSTLDPVTYALVDPDDSVRTRAQEILEELLERRQ